MARERREYHYMNSDGDEGLVEVSFGWYDGLLGDRDAPIMVSFEDAWMGIDEAEEFLRWFRVALSEAKRKHVPRDPAAPREERTDG